MSTRRLQAFALAIAAAVPLLAAPTEAQAQAWHPPVHRSDAGVDTYLWSARTYGTTLAAIPFIQFEPTPDLFINLRFPLALSINRYFFPEEKTRAGLGNPMFTIYYSDISGKLTWYAGGRAGLPLGLVDDVDWRVATSSAMSAMALYDLHLWMPDTLPFGGLGGIEYRFARWFVLRAGGDLTFLPYIGSDVPPAIRKADEFDVVFQTKVEPEFQSRAGFGGGVALMTAWYATADGDNAQVSLMPYFVYDSRKTFFMRAGALLALDEPLGPAFDRRKVASIYVQLGGHID